MKTQLHKPEENFLHYLHNQGRCYVGFKSITKLQ